MLRPIIEYVANRIFTKIMDPGKAILLECGLYALFMRLLTDKELDLCLENYKWASSYMATSTDCQNENNRLRLIKLLDLQMNGFNKEIARRHWAVMISK